LSKKTKKSKPSPKKKTETAAFKMVEIEAKLPLTDSEKVKRGEIACEKLQARDGLILERKTVANEYKARIDALTSEATKLLLEFREGREIRKVKAKEIRNFAKSQVEYVYKGQVIHCRSMTLADRQDDLPLKDKNAPLPQVSALAGEVAAAKAETKSAKVYRIGAKAETTDGKTETSPAGAIAGKWDPVAAAHQKDEDAKSADIQSVIKDETGKKTKRSSLDDEGPRA
jgi:hypothetical protein